MVSEEDFQRALDANPQDWQTRLVFADWLQDRGDPRADGYRSLGLLRLNPHDDKCYIGWTRADNPHITGQLANLGSRSFRWREYQRAGLPADWFLCLSPGASWWWEGVVNSRRGAEDAAALAFAELLANRQTELLATL